MKNKRILFLGFGLLFFAWNSLHSFIPQNVKKVLVLKFAGIKNEGVRFASLLKQLLEKEQMFFLAENSVLKDLAFYYPLLWKDASNQESISKIGELVDADGIITGYLANCEVRENVVVEKDKTSAIQTSLVLDFYYEFYSGRRGDCLEKESFSLSKTLQEKRFSFRSEQEKEILKVSIMKEGAQKVIEHIKNSRIDMKKRHYSPPSVLSEYSRLWKKYPFGLDFVKMYSGFIAPQKQSHIFYKGDLIWVNTSLRNIPQTEKGKTSFEVSAVILDRRGNIVLSCPSLLKRNLSIPVREKMAHVPLTLRFQLPENIPKGVYFLKLLFVEKVLYSSINRLIQFKIK